MSYESKLKREDVDELFDAVLLLRDREECYRFFEDICTVNSCYCPKIASGKVTEQR